MREFAKVVQLLSDRSDIQVHIFLTPKSNLLFNMRTVTLLSSYDCGQGQLK